MRENLIIYEILENPSSETTPWATLSTEDRMAESSAHSLPDVESKTCESLVKGLITNILKIETKNMVFERIHRLGKPTRHDKPRPIIARFHYYSDRERVRNEAFARKDDLKQHNLGVGVQIPKEGATRDRTSTPPYARRNVKATTSSLSATNYSSMANDLHPTTPTRNVTKSH